MSYQEDIYNAIISDSAVAALVGARVYPDVAPGSAAAPFIVWNVISSDGTTTLDGQRSIMHPLLQFDCWATSRLAAVNLAAKLRAALEGFTLPGLSECWLSFSNESAQRDQETGLFAETLEFRASCKTNS
jgi:hypothetical protein